MKAGLPSATAVSSALRRFLWGFLAYTGAVILFGAYVRATGSGAGCGAHWPLCNGELVPRSEAVQTWVEYTHRVTSGLCWFLAVALVVWARRSRAVWGAAVAILVLMTTEALIGAGVVIFEKVASDASVGRAYWMGAHLMNTFVLLAALGVAVARAGEPAHRDAVAADPLGRAQRVGWWLGAAGLLLVGVTGAVAALGDTLFPAESLAAGLRADLAADAHLFVRLRILHPFVAVAVGVGLLWMGSYLFSAAAQPRIRALSGAVVALVVLQVLAGLLNVALLAPVWMQLLHLALADALWLTWVLLGTALFPRPQPRAQLRPAAEQAIDRAPQPD